MARRMDRVIRCDGRMIRRGTSAAARREGDVQKFRITGTFGEDARA